MTALVMHPAPTVGTFHAAGDSTSYRLANRSLNWLAGRLDLRVAVSDDARELAERYFGGTYDMLFNGVEVERYRVAAIGAARPGPTIMFCGRHEPRKGLDVLLNALAELPVGRPLLGGLGRPGDGRAAGPLRRRPPHRVAGPAHRRREDRPSGLRRRVLRAVAAGRVVRRGPDRGHGRRHARSWPPTCPATGEWPAPRCDALLTPPGDTAALATALKRVLEDAELGRALARQGAGAGRGILHAIASPSTTSTVTRRSSTRPPRKPLTGRAGARVPRMGPPYHGAVMTWLIVLIVVVVLVRARRAVPLQRPGQQAEPGRERLVADRRAAQAAARPDPQPGRDREGLRRARAGHARRRRPGPQRGHDARRRPSPRPRPRTR